MVNIDIVLHMYKELVCGLLICGGVKYYDVLSGILRRFELSENIRHAKKMRIAYAIFSLGDLQGTSSSNSSSLSSPSSATSCGIFIDELVNISGTGSMLGRRELRLWFITSGLSKFGLSPPLLRGMSKWLPVIPDTSSVTDPGEVSLRHCFESAKFVVSVNVAKIHTQWLVNRLCCTFADTCKTR